MPIEWRDDYNTGIPEVDSDHRGLVDLVNALKHAIDSGETDFAPIIGALRSYVNIHFSREEKMFMGDEAYSNAQRRAHLEQHQVFRDQVQNVDARYRGDPSGFDPVDLHDYLRDWLVNHILQTDKTYAAISHHD